MKFTNRDIADYYNQTLNHYQKWWKLDQVFAVHYGIWDKSTKTFAEALLNTSYQLAEIAEVSSGQRILDAGCGVGGSSFFLAEHFDARVTGITLSEKQYDFAQRKVKDLDLASRVDFKIEDFTATSFPDDEFDLIWAIESVTSCPVKSEFAKESHRILKKGGRLIIADYFRNPGKEDPNRWMEKWQDCWSLAEIISLKDYLPIFEKEGFRLVENLDVTGEIRKSSKIMYQSYLMGAIPSMIYNAFHNTSRFAKTHYLSGKYQFKALKSGLWSYRILLYEKI